MKTLLTELKMGNNSPCGTPIEFNSTQHTRFENGISLSTVECNRQIKIEQNLSKQEGYSVTIFNTDGMHPRWGNNIQMATKPMKVISVSATFVELRGYGYDKNALNMGVSLKDASFEDYGLLVYFSPSGEVCKCTLLLHDRGISIDYL